MAHQISTVPEHPHYPLPRSQALLGGASVASSSTAPSLSPQRTGLNLPRIPELDAGPIGRERRQRHVVGRPSNSADTPRFLITKEMKEAASILMKMRANEAVAIPDADVSVLPNGGSHHTSSSTEATRESRAQSMAATISSQGTIPPEPTSPPQQAPETGKKRKATSPKKSSSKPKRARKDDTPERNNPATPTFGPVEWERSRLPIEGTGLKGLTPSAPPLATPTRLSNSEKPPVPLSEKRMRLWDELRTQEEESD
ncbi:uncharacterized protein LTR77_000840 [Saxophila tyrrhenica]|uniref:Uncharacterized protein n=1 Tax=Saxophila tyrrhenica TaxID=1690608 RepID=A0AAV9PPN0_9PEZI|nr:hypothetical protein LTR77_000840 [Saxophila tyrrhenica]